MKRELYLTCIKLKKLINIWFVQLSVYIDADEGATGRTGMCDTFTAVCVVRNAATTDGTATRGEKIGEEKRKEENLLICSVVSLPNDVNDQCQQMSYGSWLKIQIVGNGKTKDTAGTREKK